jgi:hypothetical protein
MNDAEIELLLYRIFSGKLFFFYKNEKYELRNPDITTRYEAQLLYNNIVNDEKYNEWLREENLDRILINLGLWTMDTNTIIKSLNKRLDDTKVSLYQQRLSKDKTKQNRKSLESYIKQLNGIMSKKNEVYSHTLEGYASSIKNEYIICNTLYQNNNKVFSTDIKNDENSYTLFNNIVNEINNHVIDTNQFKKLARNTIWRSYWNASKQNVFTGTSSEWTFDQRTLVSLSKMYDNIYEHPECPDEEVINDDDMLDGWMIFERRKVEARKKQQKVDELNPRLQNAQEVFLMASNQEETQEVLEMNSQESLMKIKQRSEFLQKVGTASAAELPDIKMDLRARSVELQRQQRRK